MSPAWIAIISAGIGFFIAGIFGVVNNIINKRAETKRQRRELIVKLGFDTWKTIYEHTDNANMPPPESYSAHVARVIDAMLDDKFDEEKFKNGLKVSFRFWDEELKPLLKTELNKKNQATQKKVPTEQPAPSSPIDFPPKL